MVAKCGCPYDPDYDEGYLGWHLPENHPEAFYVDIKPEVSAASVLSSLLDKYGEDTVRGMLDTVAATRTRALAKALDEMVPGVEHTPIRLD
jgi:hypothetical protein